MKISVVIPVYNEEDNLISLHKRLSRTLKKCTRSYEIIFVDDGSNDNSIQLIKSLRKSDLHVKAVFFSRNFGHMSAISAGLKETSGEKVVVMDADLQDPPEKIIELYQKSSEYDVVFAIKKNRQESYIMKILFKSFYILQTRMTSLSIPSDAGTFSILDKKVVKIINSLPEKNKFFSGLRAWSGFSQGYITYNRQRRTAGTRKSIRSLFGLAFDGIFSFSYLPLRLASLLGFLFAGLSFVLIGIIIVLRLFTTIGIIGWASTLTVILFIGGVQLITLGIIGEYLARIYDEVKGRPDYIIKQRIGLRNKRK